MHRDLKDVVVLLSLGLFLLPLCLFLLMVLVERVPAGPDRSSSRDLFLQLVLVGVLRVFLRLVLLMLVFSSQQKSHHI